MILSAADAATLQTAFAQVQAGDGDGARVILAALSPAGQGHPDAMMVAGLVARAQGQFAAARRSFAAASVAAPRHPGVWNAYANLLSDRGDHDAADTAYRRALALDPASAATWTNLGLAALAARQFDDAAAALARALALAPADSRALGTLGLVEQARGDPDAAIVAYARARAVAPDDPRLRHNMATALRQVDRHDAALDLLGVPTLAESAALRGHILADLGQFDAAVAQYRDCLAHAPGHVETLAALAELLPQLGRTDEALAGYRAVLHPAEPPALWQGAIAAAKAVGDAATMRDWAARAQAAHGRRPEWALAQAAALSQLGDAEAALAQALATARDYPGNAAAENLCAWLLLKAGQPLSAQDHALRASKLAPLDQSPWALLTLIWRLLGDGRENWLADYDRLVIAADIETPGGWSSRSAFLDDLAATLTRRHILRHAPADQSLRGGTQTRGHLFESPDPVLRALRDSLTATVETALAAVTPDASHPFRRRATAGVTMAGSWSVRLRAQGFHISHIHHSGWLSSAFYVSVPPEIGSAPGDDAGKLLFGVPDAALGLDLTPRRAVTPVPGRLVIFPSDLWHGTAPFESAEARLSVAFDAVPTG